MLKWFQKQLGTLKKPSQGKKGSKVILAYLIFGAICVTFVFWGIGEPGGVDSTGAAAEVNNKIISVGQYRRRMEELERTYSKMFGGQMDFLRKSLPRQALEGLIQFELISQNGRREGVWSTDEEIRDIITNEIPSFKENGQFRKTLYYDLLEANQLTPGEFEADIRKENLNRRLRRIFSWVAKPTSHEIQQERELRAHKMNLEFFSIKSSDFVSSSPTADGEAQKVLTEELESVLKEGNSEKVRNFVKRWKGEWRETGSFDLTQASLPQVGGSEDLVVEAFALTKESPVLPKLVHQGDHYYVLLWKAVKNETQVQKKNKPDENRPGETEKSDKELAEEMERRDGQEAFSLWLEKMEKEASIVRNPRFASQEPEAF